MHFKRDSSAFRSQRCDFKIIYLNQTISHSPTTIELNRNNEKKLFLKYNQMMSNGDLLQ